MRKLKKQGELETYTEDWFRATEVPLDLYAEGMKSEKVNIPNNVYGNQEASDGVCYAGLRAYSKDPKVKRTYYEVELTTEMEKNQLYCVSFDISLSDLSRYAVNGVGAVLSDRKVEQGNTGLWSARRTSCTKPTKSCPWSDGWETVCGTYIGTGEEEFLIIGGFHTDKDIEDEKMKKPSDVLERRLATLTTTWTTSRAHQSKRSHNVHARQPMRSVRTWSSELQPRSRRFS